MTTDVSDIDQVSVIALGHFQVARLLPHKLIEADVLTPADSQQIQVTLLLPNELLMFETQFVSVSVEQTKIVLTSKPSAPISQKTRDLAAILLEDQETMISAVGVNRDLHFKVTDPHKYREIRDELVNIIPWGSVLKNPLLRALVLQSDRYDSQSGQINVRIEASALLPQAIFVQVNDHIDFPGVGRAASEVAQILAEIWSKATENSNTIITRVRALSQ